MITKRVTFILGAGTGHDIGMPLGKNLAEQIAEALIVDDPNSFRRRVRDNTIANYINQNAQRQIDLLNAAITISKGIHFANSIDDFLESHLDNPALLAIGKLSIAVKILEAEKKSQFYLDPSNVFNTLNGRNLANTWYSTLAKLMFSGHTPQDLDGAFLNLSFVNFNYDRCLQQFLTHAIAARFEVSFERSAEIVSRMKIHHPYGSLGKIGFPFTNGGLRFGGNDQINHSQLSERIFTYSEQVKPKNTELTEIQYALEEADILVFLGFAFHEPNMRLLKPESGSFASKIIGTSIGMSNLDVEDVSASLRSFIEPDSELAIDEQPQISLLPISCNDLLQQHQRLLSDGLGDAPVFRR